jgi:hypothetical protein
MFTILDDAAYIYLQDRIESSRLVRLLHKIIQCLMQDRKQLRLTDRNSRPARIPVL